MNDKIIRPTLGSKRNASKIARRACKFIPAYQDFLAKHGAKLDEFDRLPLTDKHSYIFAYPFEQLLGDDRDRCYHLFRSSGSSGHSCYWPQLKSANRFASLALQKYLEFVFSIHQKKTLAIVGLNLGGWMGGESFSWTLKTMAVKTRYPFLVFSPGSHIDEIIEIIDNFSPLVEQILLLIVPSAIAHLHQQAEQLNKPLPLNKLKYLVTAEPFPETWRASLQNRAVVPENNPFLFSMFGAADVGGLGVESLASIALRRLLYQNPTLANSLGIDSPIPNFFHFMAPNTFVENIEGCLCVTRWQGIPVVRYVLPDKIGLYCWKNIKKAVLNSEVLTAADRPWLNVLAAGKNWYPNLLAVTGRSDRCLILGGAKLTEYILDEAVKSETLSSILTGNYRARIIEEDDRQYVGFELEIRTGVSVDRATCDRLYESLLSSLVRSEPYFGEMWQNLYRMWDDTPAKRILRLTFVPWPILSQEGETSIKQRGIVQ